MGITLVEFLQGTAGITRIYLRCDSENFGEHLCKDDIMDNGELARFLSYKVKGWYPGNGRISITVEPF